MSKIILEGSSLSKSYQSGALALSVLNGVDCRIGEGEFVSIQGESGCGKTTLLNILAGLEAPDSGYVKWGDQNIDKFNRNHLARVRSRHLGIVFQSYYLVPELDALQNVLLNQRIATGSVDVKKSEELLKRVGQGDRLSQLPSTLSGGERQRVAIARALVTSPKVILADEPTGNLDARTGNGVMDLLQSICQEAQIALVLVTHNSEHATRADRKLVLKQGTFTAPTRQE